MARDFGPFPSKPMYEVVNRRMQRALAEASASTGFVKSGQGAVTAGTGAQLIIAAYPDGALVDGLWVENPASETVTLTTNTNSNPRIDRLVMRLDMAAETIAPFQIVGTPAASPSAPPLVQTAATFDMPLCRYTFPGSASAQNPGSIVDERVSCATSVSATDRVPFATSSINPDAGVTSVITVPAAPVPSRLAITAMGRSGFGAGERTIGWDFDSLPASATNVSKDYEVDTRITAPSGTWVAMVASMSMDLPAGVPATLRMVYRANGNGYNRGAIVWHRSRIA